MSRRVFLTVLLTAPIALPAVADDGTIERDGAAVSYKGIDRTCAEAIARTVSAARVLAVEQFGFDMPKTIAVRMQTGGAVRLFNDGQDRFSLTVRSDRDLRKPAASGIFHIYGLCHEVGHLAMYRPIRDHSWMSTACAEGWAHYVGSRLVDAVHAKEGADLWPDKYDYLADGMKRLNRQLPAARGGTTGHGARLWKQLAGVIGDKGFVKLFDAWGRAKIDPSNPAPALQKALLATHSDKRLGVWWRQAQVALVVKRPKSGFAARTAKPGELSGKGVELVDDSGKAVSKNSFAGGGHAVRFSSAGPDWYLTAVKVYGARYGRPAAAREPFRLWLCDKDFKAIASFAFPYGLFPYGRRGRWVTLQVKPTQVPREFIVCVGFNPTATKGVFVYHDGESGGDSLTGLPGRQPRAFGGGDWLIRARIDQAKTADALKGRT